MKAYSSGSPLGQIFPLTLLLYCAVLLPPEAQIRFSGVNFPIYRIVILATIPVLIGRIAAGRVRMGLVDWLVMIMSGWMILSFVDIYGLNAGIVRGSGLVIDAAGAFLVARASIDGTVSLRRLLILVAPALFVAGLAMMIESISHRTFVRPAFAAVFGYADNYEGGQVVGTFTFTAPQEVRLGLLRAWGTFPHPILGGVVLASMLPLWLMGGVRSWPKWLGTASALLGVFSVSSAAFLALALALGLYTVDRLKRFTAIGWPIITAGVLLLMLGLQVGANSGVIGVIGRLTLDPRTAYFRTLIWKYGSQSVLDHPLFGIGFAGYERPSWMVSSVDAHFLLLGIRNGMLVPLLLLAVLIVTMARLGRRRAMVTQGEGDLFAGMNFSLVIVLVSGLTVTYFGGPNIWFMAVIGTAASLVWGSAKSLPTRSQIYSTAAARGGAGRATIAQRSHAVG